MSEEKKYDSYCRFELDHARLLTALEAEKQRQKINKNNLRRKFLKTVDTPIKKVSLLALPFFGIATVFRLAHDLDSYDGIGVLSVILVMLTALCLLLSFTRLGDWVTGIPRK